METRKTQQQTGLELRSSGSLEVANKYLDKLQMGISTVRKEPTFQSFAAAQTGLTMYQYLRKAQGEAKKILSLWVAENLMEAQDLLNVAHPLNSDQLVRTASLIVEEYQDFTLADVKVFCWSLIKGHINGLDYPQLYGRIDWQWLRQCLGLYLTAKIEARERARMADKAKVAAENNDWHPAVAEKAIALCEALKTQIMPNYERINQDVKDKRKDVYSACLGLTRARIEAWRDTEPDALVKQFLNDYLSTYE